MPWRSEYHINEREFENPTILFIFSKSSTRQDWLIAPWFCFLDGSYSAQMPRIVLLSSPETTSEHLIGNGYLSYMATNHILVLHANSANFKDLKWLHSIAPQESLINIRKHVFNKFTSSLTMITLQVILTNFLCQIASLLLTNW